MISIIISSQKTEVLARVTSNISQTIGVAFEIIVVENAEGKFGICEAYNRGAAKAAYEVLCFMHEDVLFETGNWGMKVLRHLADHKIGLIGVAGGEVKSLVPSSWPSYIFENKMHLIQGHADDLKAKPVKYTSGGVNEAESVPVACIDGVWMCTRKDVFQLYQFDAVIFKGFHCYDIDYSLQVNQSFSVCVIYDVLLHHYSRGSFNKNWINQNLLLSKKWKQRLPFSVRTVTREDLIRQHWTCINILLDQMFSLHYTLPAVVATFLKFALTPRLFHFRHFMYSLRKIALKIVGIARPENTVEMKGQPI